MIKPNQYITKTWSSKNKNYWTNKGYHFTQMGDEIDILAEDLMPGVKDSIIVICEKCGKEHTRIYNKYMKSHEKNPDQIDLCNDCKKNVKDQKWQKYVVDFCKRNNYELLTNLDDILNEESRIKYICPVHGVRESTARAAKDNRKCYDCTRSIAFITYRQNTKEARRDALYQKCLEFSKESGYQLITPKEEFGVSGDWIEYLCPVHGVQKMIAGNFAIKRHCGLCADEANAQRNKMDINEVNRRIEECYGKLLNPEDYINQATKNLQIICPECGEPFITSLVLFTQHGGQVCDKCESSESLGERSIRYYLEERNISYEQEKWFPDCRDLYPLPFDFYLPDYNTIIEFDGYQHYYQTDHFSFDLEKVQLHDFIKNQYCLDKGIQIIRIPYWRIKNISKILDEKLNIPHKDIV